MARKTTVLCADVYRCTQRDGFALTNVNREEVAMQEYVQEMHNVFVKKVKRKADRKVATVRLRDNSDVNDSLVDIVSSMEGRGYTLALSAKGKTTLPSYVVLRGFELLALKSKILSEAGRALVSLDIFEERR